jgi:hypothetical protein
VIEILRFKLRPGADEREFLTADSLVQTDFAYQQPGLLRRTTARVEDGGWAVIDVWRSAEASAACSAKWGADEVTAAFMSFVDADSVRVDRFTEIGG